MLLIFFITCDILSLKFIDQHKKERLTIMSNYPNTVTYDGKALIEMRKIGSDEVLSFEVSGDKIEAVYMLPGYTHSITNLSETENLVTLIWANEQFNPNKPHTFYEVV